MQQKRSCTLNKRRVTIALTILFLAYNYWDRTVGFHVAGTFGCDFWCYVGDRPCWLYLPVLKIPFYLYRFMPWQAALVNWYCIQSVFVVYVVLKLMELPYGGFLSLAYVKIAGWTIAAGNVDPMLAGLCLTAPGSLVAGIFKPYLFAFSGLAAYRQIRKHTHSISHLYAAQAGLFVGRLNRRVQNRRKEELR